MLERAHIEKLLKLNGVAPSDPDEEIKSVLISARWHKNDVDTALLVLRENVHNHQTHVDSIQKVFTSDDRLQPETISALLGVDIHVSKDLLNHREKGTNNGLAAGQILQIGLVSISISLIFVLASMWYLEMGLFHPTLR